MAAAQSLASMAEGVYDRITTFYDSYPDRIYCVINGRSNLYSNNFTPLPAHINVTIASWPWPHFIPHSEDWLELVFTHELTHYIQLVHDDGFFSFFSLRIYFAYHFFSIPCMTRFPSLRGMRESPCVSRSQAVSVSSEALSFLSHCTGWRLQARSLCRPSAAWTGKLCRKRPSTTMRLPRPLRFDSQTSHPLYSEQHYS